MCASSSLFTFISKLGMTPVLDHGSEALQQKYVPRVASGECQASYCLSEADAGSDVAGMRTRAVRDGDHYVLSGRKLWITNAGVSDFYTVFAKTDPDAGHRGISCFVVEKDFAGFSVSKLEHKMGVRGSPTGEIVLDDCAVPAENLIGDEGRGFAYAMGALDRSRPLVGAQALGIAQGALDLATRYVQDRKQFGHAIAEFQGLQFMLADMATAVDAARLLVYRACALLDDGQGRHARDRECVVDGEAVRFRHRDARHDRLRAAARRARLHQGRARRAVHPRRQDHADLRRARTRSSGW